MGGALGVAETLPAAAPHQGVTPVPASVTVLTRVTRVHFILTRDTHGQVQMGRGLPELSLPSLHSASWPQGLGWHRDPAPAPALVTPRPPAPGRHSPPARGSPTVPGGHEHSACGISIRGQY